MVTTSFCNLQHISCNLFESESYSNPWKMCPSPITPAFRARLDEDRYHNHRLGFWLPKDRKIIVEWAKQLMKRVRADPPQHLDPTLQALKHLVDKDPILKPLSEDMFTEVPDIIPYVDDPEGNRELRSFEEMLNAFNALLKQGPQWNDIANKIGLIGCPFNAILDWPMATASGYMFFLYPQVNTCLKAMLVKWEDYLKCPDSIEVLLPPNGWLGKGLTPILTMGNMDGLKPATTYTFPQIYNCPNPNDPSTYGFESWDHFFTRDFNDCIRPIESPTDDSVIVHACESAPLQYPVSNVQLSDNFQGKNQCYSLIDMMDQNPLAQSFVGGTVYQAFLSCLSYHQWHAPVSGTIKEFHLVAGTYYSQNLYQTFFGHWPEKPDPAGPTWSQPYIASVAARGLIFIEADNPAIGLVCFIAIGMTDTSGCEITVAQGQHVKKGDPMGKFHFGGSSHCLVFGPQVKLNWTGIPPKDSPLWPATFSSLDDMPNFPVKSMLATVVSSKS
jgi:phosphatidylserine decarboxylase